MAKTKGVGCLILFALPFAGGGLFAGGLLGRELFTAWQVRSWIEVPAQILAADLESHRGDDSTTYEVTARYRYELDGRSYEADRVGLAFGADNLSDWHAQRYAQLERYASSGEPFRCYVDPDHPERAILFRDVRWGRAMFLALFAVLFGGVGFGLIAAALYGGRVQKEEAELEHRYPDQPWRWSKRWENGRIRAGTKARALFSLGFATVWNLISAPALLFVPGELAGGNWLASIALVFPAVGIGLAIWAGIELLRWKKFGHSELVLETFPVPLGGRLAGTVITGAPVRADSGLLARLTCRSKRTRGSGRNRSTELEVLWQDEQRIHSSALAHAPGRSQLPITFAVPADQPPTSPADAAGKIEWALEVEAEVPGVDYRAEFEVPVFEAPEALAASSRDEESLSPRPQAQQEPVEELLREHGIRLRPAGWGQRIELPAARHKGLALLVSLFALGWDVIVAILFRADSPWILRLGFAFFGVILTLFALDLWLQKRWIEAEPGRLRFRGGWLGLGRRHVLDADEIAAIEVTGGMQAGNRLYHRIQLSTTSGRRHILASQLDSLTLARALVSALRSSLGSSA